ncbi:MULTISPECIES: serine/threonine-protein kinase [unclassified Microbulbifer]|uniref:serine/threonine-protein kinase n=1 Tax=unclassified Microbulbifer TaxID=2619833 RepID=UPI0027E48743|nr:MULTISPECIES: serine/threonine-protein kinase [unclassified Microbulbifer]
MIFPYQRAQVSFKKIEEIGQEGRNSRVYRAHDEHLDAELVIKEIDLKGRDPREFFSEAQLLYRGAHPNILEVKYACLDKERIYIATPFYKNGSLKKFMAHRFITVREIIRFSTQILNGLHHIHSKGLIHFDVKPDNVLLSDRNEALLSDFGMTKLMGEEGEATPNGFYSKHVPPEVFSDTQISFDNRYDIYQVGLTMYRMCVGDWQFDAQFGELMRGVKSQDEAKVVLARATRKGVFPDRRSYPHHIPRKLISAISKCLKPNPGERFGSAIAVVNAISDIDGPILHWQFVPDEKVMRWEQCVDGARKVLEVCNTKRESKAYRHRNGADPRRVAKFCKEEISDKEIVEFLE